MRMMLYEAAESMLVRSTKWSWFKAWAMKNAKHRGMKKAIVALARRSTAFRWTRRLELLLPHPLAPTRQRRTVEHQRMLEKLLAAEVPEVRILHPAIAQSHVGKVVVCLRSPAPPSAASAMAANRSPAPTSPMVASQNSPAASARARRITACDSRESSNRFARKSRSKGQKPANSITCACPVIQPIQWLLNFSRSTTLRSHVVGNSTGMKFTAPAPLRTYQTNQIRGNNIVDNGTFSDIIPFDWSGATRTVSPFD
jgi:hypothetical protein